MTHSYVTYYSFIYVPLLIYVCHDPFICVPRLIHMCAMTLSCVCHVACVCLTRPRCMHDKTHAHMCDIPHSSLSINTFTCVTYLIHRDECATYLIHMCDIPHSSLSIKSHEFAFLNHMNLLSHTCPQNSSDLTYDSRTSCRTCMCPTNVMLHIRMTHERHVAHRYAHVAHRYAIRGGVCMCDI